MPPSGLAIIIGAGPNTGTGIARILSSPSHGNYAVALLARRAESLNTIKQKLIAATPSAVIETFPTDTSPTSLQRTFDEIKSHTSFKDLKLKLAIYSIKHSSKKPFMEETYDEYMDSLKVYVGGAFTFSQEVIKLLYAHHGDGDLNATHGAKKGTIIFTGTLGALRANSEFAAYGASRSSVRQLAQSMARELSVKGIHVVHTIANGGIADADGDEDVEEKQALGIRMSADAVGETYLWLARQEPTLWTHELDLRPAQEKF